MDLKVEQFNLPSTITANWEEIKQEIAVKLNDYSVVTYTEEQIGRAKADRAYLNKLKKKINDERIRLEREYMKPFEDFKSRSKEVIALIDEPIARIDEQLNSYEAKRKEEKMMEIGSAFVCCEFPSWVRLNMVMNEKWLNSTYKISDIKDELTMKSLTIQDSVYVLESLDFGFEALEVYKRTLDFNKALEEGKKLAELQERKKELQEEKKEENVNEASEWRTFGGFLTDKQMDALYKWCADHDITITEV